jgi:transcriptional regulator with XRE-family HTH domain
MSPLKAGARLKDARKRSGLSLRDVVRASQHLARQRRNLQFSISASMLSAVENKGKTPGLYQLAALARIYRLSFRKVLSWYGVV